MDLMTFFVAGGIYPSLDGSYFERWTKSHVYLPFLIFIFGLLYPRVVQQLDLSPAYDTVHALL